MFWFGFRLQRLQILASNRLFSWEMLEGNWIFNDTVDSSSSAPGLNRSENAPVAEQVAGIIAPREYAVPHKLVLPEVLPAPTLPPQVTVDNVVNAFCCIRPPGHHAGRFGSTRGCTQNGFCLLNNVAIGVYYARVCYGARKIAIVDIDAHFGNGTLEIFEHDSNVFYSSVHLQSDDVTAPFFPSVPSVLLGGDQDLPNRSLVNVYPMRQASQYRDLPRPRGRKGYMTSFTEKIIPALEKFHPELIFISAGFDGAATDPIGGALGLMPVDFHSITQQITSIADKIVATGGRCKVVSVLEGGYDVDKRTDGLSACVEAHVSSLCVRNSSLETATGAVSQ